MSIARNRRSTKKRRQNSPNQDELRAFFKHARQRASNNGQDPGKSYGAGSWLYASYRPARGVLLIRFQSGRQNYASVRILQDRDRGIGLVTFQHPVYGERVFELHPRLDGEGDVRLRRFLRMISQEPCVDTVMDDVYFSA